MDRRAISPVIATVIIVAVTIAISIAVAGWLFGLFGGVSTTETLKIFPDSYIDVNNKLLVLHVQNTGGAAAEIYKINIAGIDLCSGTDITTTPITETPTLTPSTTCNTKIILPGGAEATITFNLKDSTVNLAGSTAYQVTIYTKAGNAYPVTLYGK